MAIQKVFLFSDLHAPFHDKRAWALALRAARDLKPHTIVCLGDLLDLGGVSRHLKDPATSPRFMDEIKSGRAILRQLNALKAKRKVWVKGNHDYRLETYLQEHAPELTDAITVEEKLGDALDGWEVVPYRQHARLGKLYLTHDVGVAGRYANHRALDTFEHSVLTAHTHRIGYIVEGNATGEYKVGASFGWLGDISKVEYMPQVRAMKDWALGFGIAYHNTDTGIVHVVPVPIVRYTAVVEGRLYNG